MGKSFNDDVFNNDFDIANINGLSISKEAIEENNQEKPKKELKELLDGINIDDLKEEIKRQKIYKDLNPQEELEQLREENKHLEEQKAQEKELAKVKEYQKKEQEEKEQTVKRTMIFKKEYLDIIDGLASINDMQIKDVLNQLLEKSIKELDPKTVEKALKTSKKSKTNDNKSIF